MRTETGATYGSAVRGGVWGNKIVWTMQILLALVFLAHGAMMLFPPAEIAKLMNEELPRWFQVFIGVSEVLAAIGLTLPGITGVQPWLVAWAAGGIMIIMVSATIFHLMRREFSSAATTLVLLAMATAVARVRYQPRGES